MENVIRKTWFFNAAPSELWDYLTKPELMEQWLMKTDFQPVKGQKFHFFFVAKPNSAYEGQVDCEVREINPYSRLTYTWNGSTSDRSRKYLSTVEWTLVPKEGGTELQLQHDGFIVLDDILTHTAGWDACVTRLFGALKVVQS
jgi:uncharacterized protein YndB with AHSA1/START domain